MRDQQRQLFLNLAPGAEHRDLVDRQHHREGGRASDTYSQGTIQQHWSFGQGQFPLVSVFDYRSQIVELRFPSESYQASIIRDQGNRIPDPSLGNAFLKGPPGNAFDGTQHFSYRITSAIAAIQGDAGSRAVQMA
jgi:hypothetical protein